MSKEPIKQDIRYRGDIYKFIFHNDALVDSMYYFYLLFHFISKISK